MKRTTRQLIIGLPCLAALAFAAWPLALYLRHDPHPRHEPVRDRPGQPLIGTAWDAWGSSAGGRLRLFGLPPQSGDAAVFQTSGSDWWERPVFMAATSFRTHASETQTLDHFAAVAHRLGWSVLKPQVLEHFDDKKRVSYRLEIELACAGGLCEVKLLMSTNEPWLF